MGKLLSTIAAVLGVAKAQELAAVMRGPAHRHVVYHHNGPVGHGKSRHSNHSQHSRANRRKAKRAARVRGRG